MGFPKRMRSTSNSTCNDDVKRRKISHPKLEQGTKTGSKQGPTIHAKFKITNSCTLAIDFGDITKWCVNGTTDAIVNAANKRMLGGGGVDGAIHRAAGPELRVACEGLQEISPDVRCATGGAIDTLGFKLPVSRIIHTVGPIYKKEKESECSKDLTKAYSNSLKLAREKGIEYIAFPAISCGIYRYPLIDAICLAFETLKKSSNGFKEIHFILFEESTLSAFLATAEEKFERI